MALSSNNASQTWAQVIRGGPAPVSVAAKTSQATVPQKKNKGKQSSPKNEAKTGDFQTPRKTAAMPLPELPEKSQAESTYPALSWVKVVKGNGGKKPLAAAAPQAVTSAPSSSTGQAKSVTKNTPRKPAAGPASGPSEKSKQFVAPAKVEATLPPKTSAGNCSYADALKRQAQNTKAAPPTVSASQRPTRKVRGVPKFSSFDVQKQPISV